MLLRRTSTVSAAMLLASLLVVVAIAAGLGLAPLRFLPGFRSAELDYDAHAAGLRFAPLRPDFVDAALGAARADATATAVPAVAASTGGATGTTAAAGGASSAPVPHTFTNDAIAGAHQIAAVPYHGRTDTTSATREGDDPDDCAAVGGTAWYRYQASADGGLVARTFGTSYSTALAVFTRDGDGAFSMIDCDTDVAGNALVPFAADARTTYWFQITGPVGGGDLLFALLDQGTTERVSISSAGDQADRGAGGTSLTRFMSMSGDGRYVAFDSLATNLVPEDTNGVRDAFVRDRATGTTRRVSVSSSGEEANGSSVNVTISADGRYVAFTSPATNLVPGDSSCTHLWSATGARCDHVYVHDLTTGVTERVSVSSSEENADDVSSGPAISGDGRYVAFMSGATNLAPGVSSDQWNVFVRDRVAGTTELVSMSPRGRGIRQAGWASISADGRYVVYEDWGSAHIPGAETTDGTDRDENQLFVRDRVAKTTTLVSSNARGERGDGNSLQPTISADGRYVVFESLAGNLVEGDTFCASRGVVHYMVEEVDQPCWDVFVKDLHTGAVHRASIGSSGEVPNNGSRQPRISADGRYVTFQSEATNLVRRDDNRVTDVFIRDLVAGTTTMVSVSSTGEQADGEARGAFVSGDGRFVGFCSWATNLVRDDTNETVDVFVHDRGGA